MARDKETTYRIMSAVKSKNTTPELTLGKAMWNAGLRYRKHLKVDGKPDFAFIGAKVAVFCDGDFWHGNNWRLRGIPSLKEELAGYKDYWAEKITRNVARDARVNDALREQGWLVLRFWESDIKKHLDDCVNTILEAVAERRPPRKKAQTPLAEETVTYAKGEE